MLDLLVNLGVFPLLHGIEASVGVIPYAGPVIRFFLTLVTG